MPFRPLFPACVALVVCGLVAPLCAGQRTPSQASNTGSTKEKSSAKLPNPDEELQRSIGDAGSDRAALLRNLEGFLNKYPDYPNRTSIYRALVEATTPNAWCR